jgi:hypothetical protein
VEFGMGTFLSIDEAQQILLCQYQGAISDEVLLSRYQQAVEWNAIHRYPSVISDFTGVTFADVSSRAVREAAAHSPVIPEDIRRFGVIVAPDDLAFGLARMFEVLGNRTRDSFYVARTIAEAYQVIGVESLQLKPIIEW